VHGYNAKTKSTYPEISLEIGFHHVGGGLVASQVLLGLADAMVEASGLAEAPPVTGDVAKAGEGR
jgi:hypothetical protein